MKKKKLLQWGSTKQNTRKSMDSGLDRPTLPTHLCHSLLLTCFWLHLLLLLSSFTCLQPNRCPSSKPTGFSWRYSNTLYTKAFGNIQVLHRYLLVWTVSPYNMESPTLRLCLFPRKQHFPLSWQFTAPLSLSIHWAKQTGGAAFSQEEVRAREGRSWSVGNPAVPEASSTSHGFPMDTNIVLVMNLLSISWNRLLTHARP